MLCDRIGRKFIEFLEGEHSWKKIGSGPETPSSS